MPDIDEPIVVYRGTYMAAGFLKGLLESAGVLVFLWGDSSPEGTGASGRHNPLQPERGWGVDVVIPKRDLEKAQPIVKRFLQETLFEHHQIDREDQIHTSVFWHVLGMVLEGR